MTARACPVIPVLRHLARSGGTVISRCIGCMHGVVMLSEVHPANITVTQPIRQAREWFNLVTDADITRWKRSGPPTMLQLIALCEPRAKARNQRLVLRDWTHMDYIATPYGTPSMGFALRDSLAGAYDIAEAVTTRHPLDQYLSLARMDIMRGRLTPEHYLHGCALFAEHAATVGFTRYEDFTLDPAAALQTLCERLSIPYDPTWTDRWKSYTTITGDTASNSRGNRSDDIRPFPRAEAPAALLARFRASQDYQRACTLLGYEP